VPTGPTVPTGPFVPITSNGLGEIIGSIVGVFILGILMGLGYGLYRHWRTKSTPTPESQPNGVAVASDDDYIPLESDKMSIVLDPIHKQPLQKAKSWHVDHEIKSQRVVDSKIYELVEAADSDKSKVIEFYQRCPVSGYEIASVRVIYNPDMNLAFALHMKKLQQRENNPAFKAKWITGGENTQDPVEPAENTKWRQVLHEQFKGIAEPYQDSDYPAVNLVPMWHGTKKEIADSIFRTGYANLATTDCGFFGKGIYSAYEAEYSYRVYAKEGGALIVNWVACFSAYPVIDGDMPKLKEKGNYSNYDAHFIPVVPRNPDNPYEEVYYPTRPYDQQQYMELVVFASEACLPRYLVELQRTLEKPIPLNRSQYRGLFLPSARKEEKDPHQEQPAENLSIGHFVAPFRFKQVI